jgi:alpha-beta hydrolase superfamily lysophospholipase
MTFITTKDGTKIAYKDWGKGQPILFAHGWPLSGVAWGAQMLFFVQSGYRVIAHDRRGHGKSDQPWNGNNMDEQADDLAEPIEKLDLNNLVLVGHSTGGGEVAHYIGCHERLSSPGAGLDRDHRRQHRSRPARGGRGLWRNGGGATRRGGRSRGRAKAVGSCTGDSLTTSRSSCSRSGFVPRRQPHFPCRVSATGLSS